MTVSISNSLPVALPRWALLQVVGRVGSASGSPGQADLATLVALAVRCTCTCNARARCNLELVKYTLRLPVTWNGRQCLRVARVVNCRWLAIRTLFRECDWFMLDEDTATLSCFALLFRCPECSFWYLCPAGCSVL